MAQSIDDPIVQYLISDARKQNENYNNLPDLEVLSRVHEYIHTGEWKQ